MKTLTIDMVRDLHQIIRKAIDGENQKPKALKNLTQMQIMLYLVNNEDKTIYQKDIGEALKLKKSSITEHLDYLESVGEIERVQDENDKRKNSIRLSEKARIKKEELNVTLNSLNEKAIKGISKEDLECFEKVIKNMEENLK
ncbi:MAG: MarR family transcriptional regulator [Erysipelotrichaceae bacterium]|nr:MarR family transcriptional regulator [Erysipelotrichaceae bacterium]